MADGTVAVPSAGQRTPALVVRGLEVEFGGVHALRDVSLEVEPGSVVALIGPNGAGKTTLLNAVSGLVDYRATEVSLHGEQLEKVAWRRTRRGLHRSFQHPQLIETQNVVENLLAGGYVAPEYTPLDQLMNTRRYRRSEARRTERVRELLSEVGLVDLMLAPISELPYGHRKLVDILRALVVPPRVLLLDEPSSGLDSGERRMVGEVLRSERLIGGAAILLVEHHMDLVRAVADRVVALQAGQVLMAGTPDEVLNSDALRASFTG